MLAKAMTELSEGEFKDNGNSVLVDRDTGNIFDINFQSMSWDWRTAQN